MGGLLRGAWHVAIGTLGGILIYAALFLNETEEGRIATALGSWWVRIHDLHAHSISRETAFVKVITDLTTKVFDTLFGERIWVAPAMPASVAYSTAAFLIQRP